MESLAQNGMSLLNVMSPGSVLLTAILVFYGSAFTLSFLIGCKPSVVKPLISVLWIILFLMAGMVSIEFSSAASTVYTSEEFLSLSEALSTHRWLVLILPIVLTVTNLFVLHVFQNCIAEKHASIYRTSILVCVAVGFASLVLFAFEKLF